MLLLTGLREDAVAHRIQNDAVAHRLAHRLASAKPGCIWEHVRLACLAPPTGLAALFAGPHHASASIKVDAPGLSTTTHCLPGFVLHLQSHEGCCWHVRPVSSNTTS